MNNLEIVAIEITGMCNLNCSFCVRNASSNVKDRMSVKNYEKILNDINRLEYRPSIAITGGEPFLNPNFKEIIEITIKRGFKFSINTNGTIIDNDILEICKNTELFKYFIISLDSYNEKIHNEIRDNRSAFEKTSSFIEVLNQNNIPFAVNMTINEKNYNDIDKTIKLVNEMKAKYISISTVKPSGRGKSTIDLIQMECIAEQIKQNLELMTDEFKIYVAEATFFLYDMDNYKDAINKGEKWRCAFGDSSLHIRVNGDILGCTTCELILDNIFKEEKFNLNSFWHNNETLNKVRSKACLTGKCKMCKYVNFCGGCRCRAYALTGNLFGDDLYCPLIIEDEKYEKNA